MSCQCASIAVFTLQTTTTTTTTNHTRMATTVALCSRTGFKCLNTKSFLFLPKPLPWFYFPTHSSSSFIYSVFIYAHFGFDLWLKFIHCTIKQLIIIFNTQIHRIYIPCKIALKYIFMVTFTHIRWKEMSGRLYRV